MLPLFIGGWFWFCAEDAEEADEQLQQQPQERGRLAAEAHVVTEEEAASARYSIDEVVLPLPGCRVEYPRHSTAQVSCTRRMSSGLLRRLSVPPSSMQDLCPVGCAVLQSSGREHLRERQHWSSHEDGTLHMGVCIIISLCSSCM